MKRFLLSVFPLVLIAVPIAGSQDRHPDGEFKGFSKAHVEIINWHKNSQKEVRSIQGTVSLCCGNEPLPGVIVEVRGPGDSERIYSTKTNARGEFKIGRTPKGRYVLKTTLESFQSYAVVVVVTKTAPKDQKILIEIAPSF